MSLTLQKGFVMSTIDDHLPYQILGTQVEKAVSIRRPDLHKVVVHYREPLAFDLSDGALDLICGEIDAEAIWLVPRRLMQLSLPGDIANLAVHDVAVAVHDVGTEPEVILQVAVRLSQLIRSGARSRRL